MLPRSRTCVTLLQQRIKSTERQLESASPESKPSSLKQVLPTDTVYELVGVALFVFGRAATLGIKYVLIADVTV